jgi:hypothetical protein
LNIEHLKEVTVPHLHNKPKAEVHPEHVLTGPKEEEELCPILHPIGLKKTTNTISQNGHFSSQNSNLGPLKHEWVFTFTSNERLFLIY